MEEAGLADGFETSYLGITSPVYQRAAEVIQGLKSGTTD